MASHAGTSESRNIQLALAAYQAQLELMCISVMAGSKRVCVDPALSLISEQYGALPGARSKEVVDLLVAHRHLVKLLCELRERGRAGDAGLLQQVRRQRAVHWESLNAISRALDLMSARALRQRSG